MKHHTLVWWSVVLSASVGACELTSDELTLPDGTSRGVDARTPRADVSVDASDVGPGPEACPTSNPVFEPGCEPAIGACEPGVASLMAADYQGAFGSLGADGSCQSQWPAAYLADCAEPLVEGAPDLRGLWADEGHVERVEQCGDLVIIVGDNYTHGGYVTGDPAEGVNDFKGDGTCTQPISVGLAYAGDALEFQLSGVTVVTRTLEVASDGAEELVWRFGPGLTEVARMGRFCGLADVPETAVSGLPGTSAD